MEEALKRNLLSALFIVKGKDNPVWGVTRLPIKQSRLVLPDPTQSDLENCMVSCVVTIHLMSSLPCCLGQYVLNIQGLLLSPCKHRYVFYSDFFSAKKVAAQIFLRLYIHELLSVFLNLQYRQ